MFLRIFGTKREILIKAILRKGYVDDIFLETIEKTKKTCRWKKVGSLNDKYYKFFSFKCIF